jgi:hypothetical protein
MTVSHLGNLITLGYVRTPDEEVDRIAALLAPEGAVHAIAYKRHSGRWSRRLDWHPFVGSIEGPCSSFCITPISLSTTTTQSAPCATR